MATGERMQNNHFALARGGGVEHGEAVMLARSFCPSGWVSGAHGSLCPCDRCTYRAVLMLIERKGS